MNVDKIIKILENGTETEKIETLQKLNDISEDIILQKIISRLDDDSIHVRGEAFCTLILNKNNILENLLGNLISQSKNVRAFTCLVLANRNEKKSINEISKLSNDPSARVRSAVLGALRFLKATETKNIFLEKIYDVDDEVKISALQGIIDFQIPISGNTKKQILDEKNPMIKKMILKVEKAGGPEGI